MLDKPGPKVPRAADPDYAAYVSYAGAPQQSWPIGPAQRRSAKSERRCGVIITLGTVAGLIVILLTALNPVGAAVGFVLSSVAMTVVVLAYLWLDRWEPEPPRLLVFAFLWGASVAVVLSVVLELVPRFADQPGRDGRRQLRCPSRVVAPARSRRRPRACSC